MSDRENMTIVGAKSCVCVKWLKLADMAEGPHTSCLAAHASPFLPLSFPFPLLSFPFLPFPFFPSLLCLLLCVPSHTFLPFCLPPLLSPLSSLSYFTIPAFPCLCAQGKGLSLYHRVEPLSCSHFIHMETRASLLFSFPVHTHTERHT